MTIGSRSYGSTDEIGDNCPKWATATSNTFDASTNPTLLHVESQVNRISDILNAILAQNGFDTPVTNATVVSALGQFVNDEVSAIVYGIRGSGRFGPTGKSPGQSRFVIIFDDAQNFIENMAEGFEALGAARPRSNTFQSSDTDASGDDVVPLFQVEQFGNVVQDWDQ